MMSRGALGLSEDGREGEERRDGLGLFWPVGLPSKPGRPQTALRVI